MTRDVDQEAGRGTRFVTIRIRGLWGRKTHRKLTREAGIVAITETWMKPRDLDLIH